MKINNNLARVLSQLDQLDAEALEPWALEFLGLMQETIVELCRDYLRHRTCPVRLSPSEELYRIAVTIAVRRWAADYAATFTCPESALHEFAEAYRQEGEFLIEELLTAINKSE